MPRVLLVVTMFVLIGTESRAEDIPTDEAGAIAYLKAKGVAITQNAEGHAVRLMSSGKPALTSDEYQLIGLLTQLEQVGLNAAPLTDSEWGFLKALPNLKTLAIWHGSGIASLKPFSGLPVESLTIGGCMGLRDRNKDQPEQLRHAIKTLRDLPKLKKVNLYHSPLAPDDSHLAHIASEFPTLVDLRLDFAAPRGSETTITPAGLAHLQRLPLTVLNMENAQSFTPDHFKIIAKIPSLTALLIDARRSPAPTEGITLFRELRPDVEVVVAGPDDTGPPQLKKR